METKIIILNGQGGSGKDSFKNFIKDYDKEKTGQARIGDTSMIARVKEIAKMCGWHGQKEDKDRAFLHNLKILLEQYNDLPFRSVESNIKLYESFNKLGENNEKINLFPYIFVDAREPADIERFVKNFDTTTILVRRGQRVYGNEADDNVENWNYDYIIENNGSLEDLQAAAQVFWDEFTKPERIEKSLKWESFDIENLNLLKGEL